MRGECPALLKEGIDQCGFSMVDVSDNGDIAYLYVRSWKIRPQSTRFLRYIQREGDFLVKNSEEIHRGNCTVASAMLESVVLCSPFFYACLDSCKARKI